MTSNIPDGWIIKKLNACGKIITGKTPSKAIKEYWNSNDVSFVKPDDFTKDSIIEFDKGKDFVSFEGFIKAPKIPPNSVLTTCIGNIGKVLVNKNEVSTNQQINSIVPNKDIHYKYLAYSIVKIKPIMLQRANAPVVPMINKTDFGKYEILIPPLPQQKKIVKVLDISSALIEKQKKLIRQYDLFLKSKFIEMFGDPIKNPMGWEIVRIEEIIDFLTSGSRGWAKYYSLNGEVFIRIQNVKSGNISFSEKQYINAPSTQEAKRTKVKENDLLLSITADLGRTGVVSSKLADEGAYISQHLALLRLKKDVSPVYVSAFIEAEASKLQFEKLNQGGTKAGLNFNAVNSFKLFKPPLELQNKFASIVEETETIKEQEHQKLEHLETLHNSLMSRAFKGDIR